MMTNKEEEERDEAFTDRSHHPLKCISIAMVLDVDNENSFGLVELTVSYSHQNIRHRRTLSSLSQTGSWQAGSDLKSCTRRSYSPKPVRIHFCCGNGKIHLDGGVLT